MPTTKEGIIFIKALLESCRPRTVVSHIMLQAVDADCVSELYFSLRPGRGPLVKKEDNLDSVVVFAF